MNEKAEQEREQEREDHRAHILSLIGEADAGGEESAVMADELKPCPGCHEWERKFMKYQAEASFAALELVRPAIAHDALVTALEGLMDSAECYFLKQKDPQEYDEYDEMMAPKWEAARAALALAGVTA